MALNYTTRSVFFTYHNPTGPLRFDARVTFAVYQLEFGENDSIHYQGYLELDTPCRLDFIRSTLPEGANVRCRAGSREQAIAYCTKLATRLGGPWVYGFLPPGQGARTDLYELIFILRSAQFTLKHIAEMFPHMWLKYHKGIESLALRLATPRREKTEFHVLTGEAGTGKTRLVHRISPRVYRKPYGQWFCGYDGVSDILLDEVDKLYLPLTLLLELVDRYALMLPIKGGHVPANPPRVFATSNLPIAQWYPNLSETELKSIYRRVTTLSTFTWTTFLGQRRVQIAYEDVTALYSETEQAAPVVVDRRAQRESNAVMDVLGQDLAEDPPSDLE